MELLERFASGDPDAFETLFRQFQSEVYRWIVRIVRDPGAAEDLTVETFFRIHRARRRFNPSRPFGAWARRIAINVALNHMETFENKIFVPFEETPVCQSEKNGGAIDLAVRHEIHEQTRLAVLRLPPKLRVIVILGFVEDLSDAEIAEAVGISTIAVRSRRFRAIRALRRKLDHLRPYR